MKWRHKPKPITGDTKVRSFFALLPVRIGDETRWLERVVVKCEFYKASFDVFSDARWHAIEFIDKENTEELKQGEN